MIPPASKTSVPGSGIWNSPDAVPLLLPLKRSMGALLGELVKVRASAPAKVLLNAAYSSIAGGLAFDVVLYSGSVGGPETLEDDSHTPGI